MEERFDFAVIGAGPAGEKAATQAAWFGKKVAVIEKRLHPGGIAVSDAGVPTKTLRETARYLTGFREKEIYGVSMQLAAALKLERLKARTAEVRATMIDAVRANLARSKVELVHGTAKLGRARTVLVGDRVLRAEAILLATGSRPFHPPGIPFDDPRVSDSEKILDLDRLPTSMAIVGGGAIGCEYASIFTALGVEVTLLEGAPRLLGFLDAEISELARKAFESSRVRVVVGRTIERIEPDGAEVAVTCGGERLLVEHVLFAGGRAGNTEGLGLEVAGVALDEKGRVKVDAHYRTTAPGIFAAGDVIGPPALASVSQEQGRVAACHAFGIPFKETVDPLAPIGVYSIPEAARAGMTEDEARAKRIAVEVGRGLFARNTRARIAGATEGMVKLVFRREDRVLVGVHVFGDIAAELVHLGQYAISRGRPIDDFIHATFNVPTYTEAYKYAAYDGLQRLGSDPLLDR